MKKRFFGMGLLGLVIFCAAIIGCASSGKIDNTGNDPIRVIASTATAQILADLFQEYEKVSGQKIDFTATGLAPAIQRIEAGEDFDVVILAANSIERLITAGRIAQGSRLDIAESGISVAVRQGSTVYDISNEEAVKQAALAARSVGFSTGPSGVYIQELLTRWGIIDQLRARIVQPPSGVLIGDLIKAGDVELGFQMLSELIHTEGITLLGPLPPDIQLMTIYSAGVTSIAKQPTAIKNLLDFLTSSEAASIITKNGMEPL